MDKILLILICLLISFEVEGKSNVLKLHCEYNQDLIRKKQKDIGFLKDDEIDKIQICKVFSCKDTLEVYKDNKISNEKSEYRLINSWFNHQGILLDEFSIKENSVTINTFVSQAYFLESYAIDRTTGITKRKFYRFEDSDFFINLKKLENSIEDRDRLYDKKGKLSLRTLKLFSLEPKEIFYFEGKCLEGTGV